MSEIGVILNAESTAGVIRFHRVENVAISNVTITNGYASSGGGIHCYSSSPDIVNVTIKDNSVEWNGGGFYCSYDSQPSLTNVKITGNSAEMYSGGIYCSSSNLSLKNVTIADNSSESYGGGIFCSSSTINLENVTITDNFAAFHGGGFYCSYSSSPILVNCILWNNSPLEVEFFSGSHPDTITIAYSDIAGGEEGIETSNNGTVNWLEGNIDTDPLFVDAEMGNYHLTQNSPCIDTGIAYYEYEGEVLIDMADAEFYGSAPDMGAFEYGFVNTDEFKIENVKCKISNFPNPFNPETQITFNLTEAEHVYLSVYNLKGQLVKVLTDEILPAGNNNLIWDGTNVLGRKVSSGVYLLRLKNSNETVNKKIMLIK